MRMALLAERLPAADALAAGLITAVYPADDFDAEVDKVISSLLGGPAVAFAKTKHAINAATLTEFEGALEREKQGQLALISSTDFREGTKAFQLRRPAKFTDS
jgi:enoyl-CoA hydratase